MARRRAPWMSPSSRQEVPSPKQDGPKPAPLGCHDLAAATGACCLFSELLEQCPALSPGFVRGGQLVQRWGVDGNWGAELSPYRWQAALRATHSSHVAVRGTANRTLFRSRKAAHCFEAETRVSDRARLAMRRAVGPIHPSWPNLIDVVASTRAAMRTAKNLEGEDRGLASGFGRFMLCRGRRGGVVIKTMMMTPEGSPVTPAGHQRRTPVRNSWPFEEP